MTRVQSGCLLHVSSSRFSCTIFYLFYFFPSLYFFPFSFHFFSLHAVSFARSSSSSSESFLIDSFLFLVSLFELPFCFCVLVVDHSLVWSDCPSVSFFFARLCDLLESIGRKCPRVGSFVGRDCSYRFVMLFLFSLDSPFSRSRSNLDNVL